MRPSDHFRIEASARSRRRGERRERAWGRRQPSAFMDPTALAALREGSRAAGRAGATLRVTVPEGEVSRLLALTGDDVLPDVVSVPPAAAV